MRRPAQNVGLVRSSGLLGAATAMVRLSNVGLLALLGRAAGPEAVGFYGVATLTASFISLGFSLGFPTYLTRSFSAGIENEGDVRRVHWLRFAGVILGSGIATTLGLATVPGAFFVAFLLFAITAMLDHWNETAWVLVRGTKRAALEPTVNVAGYLLVLGSCLPLYLSGNLSAESAALAAFSGGVLRSALAVSATKLWSQAGPPSSTLRQSVRSAIPYWASDLLGLAYLRGDVAILTVFVPAASLGYYVAATALTNPMVQVAASMSAGALAFAARIGSRPSIASDKGQGDRHVVRFFCGCGLLVGGGLSLSFPIIVPLLFGSRDASAIVALASILALFLPVKFLNFGLQSILLSRGKPGAKLIILAASVLLNGLLNLWWAPSFGVTGAAWATLVTELLVLVFYLATRTVRVPDYAGPLLWLIASVTVACMVLAVTGYHSSTAALISGATMLLVVVLLAAMARSAIPYRSVGRVGGRQ